ncbi:DNA methyltransferase [Shewanella sp. JL219SE-S6]
MIERVLTLATNPGDLVLDSFAGSGTTGAVAHKMGRRWIMVELGDHCETNIVPRLKKVIDGEDQGGISKAVNWQGGGGFRYLRLAPSLLQKMSGVTGLSIKSTMLRCYQQPCVNTWALPTRLVKLNSGTMVTVLKLTLSM